MIDHSPQINEALVEEALRLEKDMVKEGLNADIQFIALVAAIRLGYAKLGKHEESEKYLNVVEVLQKCWKDDD